MLPEDTLHVENNNWKDLSWSRNNLAYLKRMPNTCFPLSILLLKPCTLDKTIKEAQTEDTCKH